MCQRICSRSPNPLLQFYQHHAITAFTRHFYQSGVKCFTSSTNFSQFPHQNLYFDYSVLTWPQQASTVVLSTYMYRQSIFDTLSMVTRTPLWTLHSSTTCCGQSRMFWETPNQHTSQSQSPYSRPSRTFHISAYTQLNCLLWAACTLAYFGFLRSAEFCTPTSSSSSFNPAIHLCQTDIQILPENKGLQVLIKANLSRKGTYILIGATNTSIRTVMAMSKIFIIAMTVHHPLLLSSLSTTARFLPVLHFKLNYVPFLQHLVSTLPSFKVIVSA